LLKVFKGYKRSDLRRWKREELKRLKRTKFVIDAIKQKAHTEAELKRKFDVDFKEVEKLAQKEQGYSIFYQRNRFNEQVVLLIKDFDRTVKIKPRKVKITKAPNGKPYIWVQFPNKWSKIKIVPISDIHYGHIACNVQTLKQDIEYILHNDNVFCFLNGDLIENASKVSVASGVYEQKQMPNEQIEEIIALLAPIAHKILWYVGGNHEERVYKHLGVDVAQMIADRLNIPYFNEPTYIDLLWKGYRWTVFAQHGSTGAATEGGQLNAAKKPLEWTEFTNFYIMGHVHNKGEREKMRIIRDTENFDLYIQKQYILILSAYMRYFGTYGARKGYPPPSTGRLAMKIYDNGDYYVGS